MSSLCRRRTADSGTNAGVETVPDLVFFYGTLRTGFDRRRRAGIEERLSYVGKGSMQAALYDLGIYPAAVPAPDGRVWGEVHEIHGGEVDATAVFQALDTIEGHRPTDPDHSLYTRSQTDVTLEDGRTARAWAYFYNAPLGQAPRIPSGDYLDYVRVR